MIQAWRVTGTLAGLSAVLLKYNVYRSSYLLYLFKAGSPQTKPHIRKD